MEEFDEFRDRPNPTPVGSQTSTFSEKLSLPETPPESPKKTTPKSERSEIEKEKEATVLYEDKCVELIEDVFGIYVDDKGSISKILRYTWKNTNKIEVQVITYGARIISIKVPDRRGRIEDIVLGFDDLAGYLYYKRFFFGAVIGRCSGIVKPNRVNIDGKQFNLSSNREKEHCFGGERGMDCMIWTPYVNKNKVILSCTSPDLSEGYPGELFTRISFELTSRNEFSVKMEAQTTRPTIVNLSNRLFFNLAGHHYGSEEIYKHVLTLNCNCFTPCKKQIPTGTILNVVHTEFDFQVPRTLGKVMGIVPKDGFDQFLCVNRGTSQDECFVARVLHPPSGRMLEIYSNQLGVHFSSGNHFGYGERLSIQEILQPDQPLSELDQFIEIVDMIYHKLSSLIKQDPVFDKLKELIVKIKNFGMQEGTILLSPLQILYLKSMLDVPIGEKYPKASDELKEIVQNILLVAMEEGGGEEIDYLEDKDLEEQESKSTPSLVKSESSKEKLNQNKIKINYIPPYYTGSKKICGKHGAVYQLHSGIALSPENYPNAVNTRNFPNTILKPGETYVHTITYKFWVRAGNPHKWIRRNFLENNKLKCFK